MGWFHGGREREAFVSGVGNALSALAGSISANCAIFSATFASILSGVVESTIKAIWFSGLSEVTLLGVDAADRVSALSRVGNALLASTCLFFTGGAAPRT